MAKLLPLFWLVRSYIVFYLISSFPAVAQVIPDATLQNNSSVTTEGSTNIINGGTQAESNLFHSFEQFSIPTNGTAQFNNAIDIQNIFSRVTGGSISNINGLIRANGTANLFLINPNGIIFGPNARLDIGGSFVGSTASSLNFADGKQFSANTPQNTQVLTVSVPIGLGFGSNSGRIQVQGTGAVRDSSSGRLLNRAAGLSVQPSATLALVGNDVTLEGGILATNGGRIEVGSVSDPGLVKLASVSNGWALDYSNIRNFGNIQLSGTAAVDASAAGAGDIFIQGKQLTLTEDSQIENSTLGEKSGGTLKINTSDSIELIGTAANSKSPSGIGASVQPNATGNGSNLTIETGRLIIRDGAVIQGGTFGTGRAGELTVKAKDLIELSGTDASGRPTFLSSEVGATGNGSNLTVETGRLIIRDGAVIQGGNFGTGGAGELTVKAKDLIELSGTDASGRPTALSTRTEAAGKGGNLTIETGRLIIRDGGQVLTATFGEGEAGSLVVKANDIKLIETRKVTRFPTTLSTSAQRARGKGGDLTIETGKLSIQNGAQIGTNTSGTGAAGNLTVKAKDLVELTGTTASGRPSTLSTRTTSSGSAGDLRIETRRLSIQDEARLNASSEDLGRAGQIEVQADFINLKNQAQLIAETLSGAGGDITLKINNSLLLTGNSQISATANNIGNGGNINIDTSAIAALGNSDITANAGEGQGGNIQIRTQGIFGIQPRTQLTPESDITASSELGLNGVINITTLGFDVNNVITPLQVSFIPSEQALAGSCLARRNAEQGSFVVTGSGGLPLSSDSSIQQWDSLTGVQTTGVQKAPNEESEQTSLLSSRSTTVASKWKIGDPVVEAQGIIVTADKRKFLGGNPQQANPASPQSLVCGNGN